MPIGNNPLLVPPVLPTPAPINSSSIGTGALHSTNAVDAAAPQCNLFWVKDFAELMNHPTSPKEHLYFGDENEQIIYVRETDANGQIKSPIKALHYTIEEIPIGPEAQFVTKDEHKQLYSLVERLSENIDAMNEKLEKLLNG